MRKSAFTIFLSCLCCSLFAQSRNHVEQNFHTRENHPDRDFYTLGSGSTSHFAPETQSLLVSDTGFVVIPQFQSWFTFGHSGFQTFPDITSDQPRFELKGVSPDGEIAWDYTFEENIIWAGMTTLVGDQIYFVVNPDRIFIFPPSSDDTITAPELPANIIVCLSLETGDELWRNEVPGFISGLKAAHQGRVYVTYTKIQGIGNAEHLAAFAADGQNLWDLQVSRTGIEEEGTPE